MASAVICNKTLIHNNLGAQISSIAPRRFAGQSRFRCFHKQSPKNAMKEFRRRKPLNPIIIGPDDEIPLIVDKSEKNVNGIFVAENRDMMVLCAVGYYVNGFRGFPWLALNFHMSNNLNMHPSVLQIVQNSGNLPMAAKPFIGVLSDALYISGAHRIPYVSIGGMQPCI